MLRQQNNITEKYHCINTWFKLPTKSLVSIEMYIIELTTCILSLQILTSGATAFVGVDALIVTAVLSHTRCITGARVAKAVLVAGLLPVLYANAADQKLVVTDIILLSCAEGRT